MGKPLWFMAVVTAWSYCAASGSPNACASPSMAGQIKSDSVRQRSAFLDAGLEARTSTTVRANLVSTTDCSCNDREALKHAPTGYWTRRITDQFRIRGSALLFAQWPINFECPVNHQASRLDRARTVPNAIIVTPDTRRSNFARATRAFRDTRNRAEDNTATTSTRVLRTTQMVPSSTS